MLFTNDCQYGLYYPNWSKGGIPLTITTWDGNLTACPAWQWPFAPRQPAAERQRHHGSLGSSRAAGYVSGRPEWCLSVAPGAQPSLTAAYLGKSQGSAHAASLNGLPRGESRGLSLTQTAAGYEHLHFIFWFPIWEEKKKTQNKNSVQQILCHVLNSKTNKTFSCYQQYKTNDSWAKLETWLASGFENFPR